VDPRAELRCDPLGFQCMTVYHHLLFDLSDHVESVESREAQSDDEAVTHATHLLPSIGHIRAVEVWKGHQRVRRVEITAPA
jgi:hypothetical protein